MRLLLGRRLPVITGSLTVAGISAPVTIRRDAYGIPYVDARTDEDVWYGLGFCHGQDRGFQVEGLVRAARGTLAKVIGPDVLNIDRLSRRVGLLRAAERQLEAFGRDVRMVLEAYARGVNDGVSVGSSRKAHEFALLRTSPSTYTPADVLAVTKLLSLSAASNWDSELARLKILAEDGPEALAALDPTFPRYQSDSSTLGGASSATIDRVLEDVTLLASIPGFGGASNNWAIAPSRTATGRAILANDAHLPPTLPSIWYLVRLRTPDWGFAGASFAGTPVCPAGHNEHAAWGVTYGFSDNTDLFLEELSPDGRSVREDDGFVPCEVRREVIRVKGGPDVEETVLETKRGPILSPALEGVSQAVSMRAIWLDPTPIDHAFELYRCENFDDFRRAWSSWPFMSLNMVYADTAGDVGWQLVGDVPQRRKGWGTLPLPGWDSETGWADGPVPFEEIPHILNPDTGFVATANGPPAQSEDGPYLGVDWDDGYRAKRLLQMLGERDDWDMLSVQRLQMDEWSVPWSEMREVVLALPRTQGDDRLALEMLASWDGVVGADSPAAAVYEFFVSVMVRRISAAKAPNSYAYALGHGFSELMPRTLFGFRRVSHLSRLLREQPEGWFDRPWRREIADALAEAIVTLRERFGRDPRRWAWGRVRPLTLRHPAGRRRPLGRLFNLGPFPWGGDAHTVSQAAVDPLEPPGDPFAIAVVRMSLDVGNWESNHFVLPGGQSGNPLSPHYGDMLPMWRTGEGVAIAWSEESVTRVVKSMLRLTPDGDTQTSEETS